MTSTTQHCVHWIRVHNVQLCFFDSTWWVNKCLVRCLTIKDDCLRNTGFDRKNGININQVPLARKLPVTWDSCQYFQYRYDHCITMETNWNKWYLKLMINKVGESFCKSLQNKSSNLHEKTRPSLDSEAATIYKLKGQSSDIRTSQGFKYRELVRPASPSSWSI